MKYHLDVLLLTPDNVTYVGGSVDSLVESNKQEIILHQEL